MRLASLEHLIARLGRAYIHASRCRRSSTPISTHLTVERRLAVELARELRPRSESAGALRVGAEPRQSKRLSASRSRGASSRDLMARGPVAAIGRARGGLLSAGSTGFSSSTDACRASPADDLRPPRAWQALPTYLSVERRRCLIAQPDVTTPRGLRDRALIELLYATGLRVIGARDASGRPTSTSRRPF